MNLIETGKEITVATIYHQVGIRAPVEKVFDAIATLEGISGWWTPTTGDSNTGGMLSFNFGEHNVIAKVTGCECNKYIEWTVQGEPGPWLNTRICFNLVTNDDQVFVNFQHADWEEATELFSHCSTKWAIFLVSLKAYIETGTGKPFPNDIHINHTDF